MHCNVLWKDCPNRNFIMTLVLHLFILLQYVVSSSWTLYKLTSFSTICIRLYVSLFLEYLLRNHSANILQSQMSYCIIYVHLIKGLKMYLSFHSLFSRWLISQLTIMEEDDVHYCMKCKTEIQGLEQYIQHRKDGCPANAKPQGKFKWWCVWFISPLLQGGLKAARPPILCMAHFHFVKNIYRRSL